MGLPKKKFDTCHFKILTGQFRPTRKIMLQFCPTSKFWPWTKKKKYDFKYTFLWFLSYFWCFGKKKILTFFENNLVFFFTVWTRGELTIGLNHVQELPLEALATCLTVQGKPRNAFNHVGANLANITCYKWGISGHLF